MPLYFFDIRDQEGTEYDTDGVELADIAAARIEARRALAEIMQEEIQAKGTGAVRIEIRLGQKSVVEVVAASDDRDLPD